MTKIYRSLFLIILLVVLVFFNCINSINPPNTSTTTTTTTTIKEIYTEYRVIPLARNHVNSNEEIEANINDLSDEDVYFIITTLNPNKSFRSKSGQDMLPFRSVANNLRRGKESISKFNENPFAYLDPKAKDRKKVSGNKLHNSNILKAVIVTGDQKTFYDDENNSVAATCRYSNTIDGITLNIWIENKYWFATPDNTKRVKNPVNQDMVDRLANRFLNSSKEDIYHWVSNVFGEEWGDHDFDNVLTDSEAGNINILLYDIDNDEDFISGLSTDGVLGFFYPRDNYTKSVNRKSNEMLMFYIDAPFFSYKSGSLWNINDEYPSEIVSTLAHEFQHMINFYQKGIKNGTGNFSEAWLNEMCSMIAEDLLSDKLDIDGPRGINGNNPSSILNNKYGRLPLFNRYNSESLTRWIEDENELRSYSTSYAFGAYIARNFGGAKLFNGIVTGNDDTDYMAVINSINSLDGTSETFLSLLQKWGVAVLISDLIITDDNTRYKYNNGNNWFESTFNGYIYNLGSINLYDYRYSSQLGPYFIDARNSIKNIETETNNDSNCYILVGKRMDGSLSKKINLHPNQHVTILLKK